MCPNVNAHFGDRPNQWIPVSDREPELANRWLSILHRVDRRYSHERMQHFTNSPAHQPWRAGGSFYFGSPVYELILRLVADGIGEYHLVNVGSCGRIDQAHAVGLVVEQCAAFAKEWNQHHIWTTCPTRLDDKVTQAIWTGTTKHPQVDAQLQESCSECESWLLDLSRVDQSVE